MAQLVLQLKDLVKLNLLHLTDFRSDLEVSHFVFTVRAVGEDIIELHHRLLKRFDLEILRLHHDEELVELLDQVINLRVQI